MFKKIKRSFITLSFVLLVAVLFFLVYQIVSERYLSNKKAAINTSSSIQKQVSEKTATKNENDDTHEEASVDEGNNEPIEKEKSYVEIDSKDCETKCSDFKNNVADFKYCQEYCGLASFQQPDDCIDQEGLEKDYCWKNEAVSKKDYKTCLKINDEGIRKTCQNRISEDILDPQ